MAVSATVLAIVALLIAIGLAFLQLRAQRWREERFFDMQHESERRRAEESMRLNAVVDSLAAQLGKQARASHEAFSRAPSAVQSDSDTTTLADPKVLAELAHSLRTPLNAVRHEADAIAFRYRDNGDLANQALNIVGFTNLCDTVLATFRQLVDTARRTERLQYSPLPDTLLELHAAVESRHERATKIELRSMPAGIIGYANGYLATLLLPLIENAVEASPIGGVIQIEFDESPPFFHFVLTNRLAETPDGPVFPEEGVSTKHDGPGLGLGVARRLADMRRRGGRVDTSAEADVVRVRVRLPIEEERRS